MYRIPLYVVSSYKDVIQDILDDEYACRKFFIERFKKELKKPESYEEAIKKNIRKNKFLLNFTAKEQIAKGYKDLIALFSYKEECKKLLFAINSFFTELQISPGLQKSHNAIKLFEIISSAYEEYLDYKNEKVIESLSELDELAKEHLYIEGNFTEMMEEADKMDAISFLKAEKEDFIAIKSSFEKYKEQPTDENKKILIGKINSYIVKYARYPNTRYRRYVEKIIEELRKIEEESFSLEKFISELKGIPKWDASKKIYYKMLEILKKGDIQGFMRLLGIYGYITASMENAPFKRQVDELEKKIYEYIEKNNLWDKLSATQ